MAHNLGVGNQAPPPAAGVDRISSLPEKAQLRILSFLPLKAAARLGMVSKRWRDVVHLPQWPCDNILGIHICPVPASCRCPHATHVCFFDLVPLLASLDDRGRGRDPGRRLLRFMLSIEDAETDPADFDYLLRYAADCHVEHVTINARLGPPNLSFDFLRASSRLLHLSLFGVGVGVVGGVNAHRPMSQSRFINPLPLEVMRIESTNLGDLDLEWILLSCPHIRTLDLRLCRGLTRVDVTAASARLLSLTVAECPQVDRVSVSAAVLLRSFRYSGGLLQSVVLPQTCFHDLYICFTTPTTSFVRLCNWLDALPNLSYLVVLTMCSNALMILFTLRGTGNFQPQLAKLSNLQNLRQLQLVMYAMYTEMLSYMYGFLRMCHCSRLESLLVELPRDARYSFMDAAVNGLAEEPGMDDFENLVIVKITNFRWQWNEIKLVHFCFRKARSLRKVILVLPKGTTPERDPSGNASFPELELLWFFENRLPNVEVIVLDERAGANIRAFHRDVFSQQ